MIACLIVGLDYIHNELVIHCDLKPSNIVLDKDGYLYISDFSNAMKESEITDRLFGSPGYIGIPF